MVVESLIFKSSDFVLIIVASVGPYILNILHESLVLFMKYFIYIVFIFSPANNKYSKSGNWFILIEFRYKIEDQFEIERSIKEIESIEDQIKEQQVKVTKAEQDKKEKKDDKELTAAKTTLKELFEKYRTLLREKKALIGTNLFNRFNRGFARTHNEQENENIAHSEFLFKKLRF